MLQINKISLIISNFQMKIQIFKKMTVLALIKIITQEIQQVNVNWKNKNKNR